jgi:L-fuconate dehydratase
MSTKITNIVALDIRFPTSQSITGSDAMNPAPDYSAAYVILKTDHPQGLVVLKGDRYMPPQAPGFSIEIKPGSLAHYEFPNGAAWKTTTGD